jgi:hypothetical protein
MISRNNWHYEYGHDESEIVIELRVDNDEKNEYMDFLICNDIKMKCHCQSIEMKDLVKNKRKTHLLLTLEFFKNDKVILEQAFHDCDADGSIITCLINRGTSTLIRKSKISQLLNVSSEIACTSVRF